MSSNKPARGTFRKEVVKILMWNKKMEERAYFVCSGMNHIFPLLCFNSTLPPFPGIPVLEQLRNGRLRIGPNLEDTVPGLKSSP